VNGLRQARVAVDQLASRKFTCSSDAEVPACIRRVEASGILGDLAGRVFKGRFNVYTNISGRIEYMWKDHTQSDLKRTSPLSVDVPLFTFGLNGAECGNTPVDHSGKPLQMSLDKKDYRIPVDWRGELLPAENKRFGLSISAPKSSRHVFQLVLELSDGNRIASPSVSMSYFTPRFPRR
jgi:hypothetical protein